jgi:membrane-associated protein
LETLREWFHFLTDVRGLVQTGGLIALAIIVFVETGLMVGFFLPGDSLLVTAGLFAAKGDLNIFTLNALLMVCAVAGDATGYLIGRKLGPALFRKEDSLLFKKKHLIATHEFYERHGGKTIILARFVPVIRTFAPVVAGMANMPYRKFAVFNIIGGVGWVFSMTMIGYLLVTLFPATEKHIELVILIVVFVSILPAVIEWLRQRSAAKKA